MKLRVCKHCKEGKTYNELVKDRRKPDGVIAVCKKCYNNKTRKKSYEKHKERLKEEYKINPEKRKYAKDRSKSFRENNPEAVIYGQARYRHYERFADTEFNLSIEDIVIPAACPILNVKLSKPGGDKKYSPSLDRIDNTVGYVKGNVRVVSYKANHMKADASREELENFANNILNYLDDIV